MKDILSVKDIRMSDQECISRGIPSKELMFQAAMGVYKSFSWYGKIGIFCGSGNNAGDGYALALILYENNFNVEIILNSDKFSLDGKYYFDLSLSKGIKVYKFSKSLNVYDIYVDALLGTGFRNGLKQEIKDCINYLNNVRKPVISIDINSGLNGDTGLAECAVKSSLTVSIGYIKPGLLLNQAKDYIGKLVNIDIGLKILGKSYKLFDIEDVASIIKNRPQLSNKGTYGYVGILGGSENYPGALKLANLGQTALRCGCGVSKLIVPSSIYDLIFENVLETTITSIPSQNGKMIFDSKAIDEALKGLRVLGIGVGWGESIEYKKILEYILLKYELIIVIDADGINTLAKMDLEILNKSKCKIILTPHLKEFSRLTNYEVADIMNNLIVYGEEFTKNYHVTLLLKGPTTLVFDNNQVYFCNSGNSGMATAGSGDVLTGIITGLLGYHNENIGLSVAAAAYINGCAGDLAADKYTKISMISSDTVSMIPEVFKMAEKY